MRSLLLLSLAGCAVAPSRPPGPPNVVVILADDLGWADLGHAGSDLHETPNLDRLAREGLRFTDAYASAPVCTPTRAALLTGKHPARLGMTIWREAAATPQKGRLLVPPVAREDLPAEETTLAEALATAGYATGHVGKWHLGAAGNGPADHGFARTVGGTHWGAPTTYFHPFGGPWQGNREIRNVPGLESRPGDYLTDRLTDEAIRFVESAGEKPFFLYLAYHAPHTPIEGKPALVERYAAKVRADGRHVNPSYAAMIHSLDENVGRLLARLSALGLDERTVVVFTSDNGGYIGAWKGAAVTSNAPLRSGKGSLYEGGIRVPLIVRWPGVTPAGAVCSTPVATADLHPTLLEIAGAPAPSPDAESLVPLLRRPTASLARESLCWHYPHYYATTTPAGAIRSGPWKLVEYFEDGRTELYNLETDLAERADLSGRESERVTLLRGRLHDWRRAVGAALPAKAR